MQVSKHVCCIHPHKQMGKSMHLHLHVSTLRRTQTHTNSETCTPPPPPPPHTHTHTHTHTHLFLSSWRVSDFISSLSQPLALSFLAGRGAGGDLRFRLHFYLVESNKEMVTKKSVSVCMCMCVSVCCGLKTRHIIYNYLIIQAT